METPIERMIRLIEENPKMWPSLWDDMKKTLLQTEKQHMISFHIAGQKLKNESGIENLGEMRNSAINEYDKTFNKAIHP